MFPTRYFIIFIPILYFSCTSKNQEKPALIKPISSNVEFAHGFDIFPYSENIYKVVVKKSFMDAEQEISYWMVPKELNIPDSLKSEKIIRTPVKHLVVTSTSHIPMLDYLEETASLSGFPTLDYISSEKMRARIDSGLVTDIGRDNALNFETLVSIKPELVMTYMLSGDRTQLDRLENAGIPVMINADYLEQDPLGRAEWIKVAGILFDKKEMSDSIFNFIAREYKALKLTVSVKSQLPTILTGIMYGDTWYLPGGKNYAANLFRDAGMNYQWRDNEENGFLQLSFESVYDKAKDAELWIGTASIEKLEVLKNTDSRYTWFNAYKEGNVYTYTARMGAKGGNEYLELGYMRPDLILGDLIQIAHPELMKGRDLYFYEKVE